MSRRSPSSAAFLADPDEAQLAETAVVRTGFTPRDIKNLHARYHGHDEQHDFHVT